MVSTCLSKGDGCVAQLVEWLLPMPEIRSLNPIIGIFYNYRQLCWKYGNKEKPAEMIDLSVYNQFDFPRSIVQG